MFVPLCSSHRCLPVVCSSTSCLFRGEHPNFLFQGLGSCLRYSVPVIELSEEAWVNGDISLTYSNSIVFLGWISKGWVVPWHPGYKVFSLVAEKDLLCVEAFPVTAGARWSEGWWRVGPSPDVEQSRCCAFRLHLLTPSQTERGATMWQWVCRVSELHRDLSKVGSGTSLFGYPML